MAEPTLPSEPEIAATSGFNRARFARGPGRGPVSLAPKR